MSAPPRAGEAARGALKLAIKVVPRASATELVGWLPGDVLKVRVQTAPADGKANAAVEGLLAAALGLKRGDVSILSGHTGTRKVVAIERATRADIDAALAKRR